MSASSQSKAGSGIAFAMIMLVQACGMFPLQALMSPRYVSLDTMATMDPGDLRVAVELPRPVQPKPSATWLELGFVHKSGDDPARVERYQMVLVNQGVTLRAGGLPDAEPGHLWYLFKLLPSAEAGMGLLQSELGSDMERFGRQYASVRLNVEMAVRDAMAGQSVTRAIWVQLDFDRAFEPLVRQGRATVGPDGALE